METLALNKIDVEKMQKITLIPIKEIEKALISDVKLPKNFVPLQPLTAENLKKMTLEALNLIPLFCEADIDFSHCGEAGSHSKTSFLKLAVELTTNPLIVNQLYKMSQPKSEERRLIILKIAQLFQKP